MAGIVYFADYFRDSIPLLRWSPAVGQVEMVLGTLLAAQAAIAALTLAVTLFLMQGVSSQRDADERIYREYVRRSGARIAFWTSLAAVAVTGTVLLTETFLFEAGRATWRDNPALLAGAAFVVNLLVAGFLFVRAVHLGRPSQWRVLTREVNERDVREAVQAFRGRWERVTASIQNAPASVLDNPLDIAEMAAAAVVPDEGENSANEAICDLRDAARRAMNERRHREFEQVIKSIEDLVYLVLSQLGLGMCLRKGPIELS